MSNLVGKLVKTHGIIALPVIMSVGLLMSLSDLRPADAIGGGYGKGRVVLRESGFDFGRTPQQARVAKKFYIVNGGSDTLRIINIDPGCGCTKAPITRDLIPAGDSAQVEIILSSGRKRNAYEKPTKITTSDMFARTVTYDIAAYVIPDGTPTSPVFCAPSSLNLTTDNCSGTHRIKIKNVMTEPTELKLIWYEDDFLTVNLPKTQLQPGETTEAVVNVLEDRPDKTFEKSFTFEAGVEDGERFTIPIRVIKAKTPGSEARSAG